MTWTGPLPETCSKRPGTPPSPRQPFGDLVEGQAERQGAAHRNQGVLDVEGTDQIGCDGDGSLIRHQIETRPDKRRLDSLGANIAIVTDPDHWSLHPRGNGGAHGVVDIDHGSPHLVLPEQPLLGVPVRLHRPVEVEMVLGQVGERRDFEPGAGDAVHLQGV